MWGGPLQWGQASTAKKLPGPHPKSRTLAVVSGIAVEPFGQSPIFGRTNTEIAVELRPIQLTDSVVIKCTVKTKKDSSQMAVDLQKQIHNHGIAHT
jgi:hypothetical protein